MLKTRIHPLLIGGISCAPINLISNLNKWLKRKSRKIKDELNANKDRPRPDDLLKRLAQKACSKGLRIFSSPALSFLLLKEEVISQNSISVVTGLLCLPVLILTISLLVTVIRMEYTTRYYEIPPF